MSTRGTMGFVIDGEEKLVYNHSDSYPDWLGDRIIKWIRSVGDWGEVNRKARALRAVDGEPTEEDLERFAQYHEPIVSSGKDWYALLRHTQGDPQAMLDAGVYEHSSFALDSLMCEWGYVIDLDKQVLEVYRGFQQTPPTEGRFAGRLEDEAKNQRREESGIGSYYEIGLVGTWPFESLPTIEDIYENVKEQV